MQHLTVEDLGRLLEEDARTDEAAHLAECLRCAEGLEWMRARRGELAKLPDPVPPPRLWDAVEAGLRAEGLVRGPLGARPIYALSPAMRAAAAAALFLLGSVAGGVAVAWRSPGTALALPGRGIDLVEATENLQEAEASYLQAVSTYAELVDPADAVDPFSRLAALEGILLTTGAALRDAPADPVINNYHLTALGMRDALIRQLGEVEAQPATEVEGERWY